MVRKFSQEKILFRKKRFFFAAMNHVNTMRNMHMLIIYTL